MKTDYIDHYWHASSSSHGPALLERTEMDCNSSQISNVLPAMPYHTTPAGQCAVTAKPESQSLGITA